MTIFTITYNESLVLPFFVNHYRSIFPNCKIIIYDNYSNDGTVAIAKKNNCEVRFFDTDGKLNDLAYLEIKNNYWKDVNDWVVVCDCDELLCITENELIEEEKKGVSIIQSEGYNMVNLKDNKDLSSITYGVRSISYDKIICFDARKITDINYQMGCHVAAPNGDGDFSEKKYILKHFKYINIEYVITRHKLFSSRLSDENLKKGYGGHYLYPARQIKNEFLLARLKAKEVL